MAGADRISTYIMHNTVSNNFADINKKIENKQQLFVNTTETSFANVSKKYDIAALLSNITQLNTVQNRASTLDMINAELEFTQNTVENILNIIDDTKRWLYQAANPVEGRNFDVGNLANISLGQLQDELNKPFNGSYIFGGVNINDPSVKDLQTTSNFTHPSTFSKNYYNGSATYKSYILTTASSIDIPISAYNDEIASVIGAINMAKYNFEHTPKDQFAYFHAIGYLDNAHEAISGYLTFLGNSMTTVATQMEIDMHDLITLNDVVKDAIAVDQTDVLLEVSQLSLQLQASIKIINLVLDPSLQIATYMK